MDGYLPLNRLVVSLWSVNDSVVCRFLHGYHLATIRRADLVLLWPLYYTLPYDYTDACVLYKWVEVRNVRCYNKQLFFVSTLVWL